jgi:outer membrane protein assembly factor BamA
LGGSDLEFETEAFYEQFGRIGYDETHAGASAGVAHPWRDDGRWRVRLKAYHVDLDADDPGETEEDLDGDYAVAALAPSFVWDKRDDERFPTSGYRWNVGLEGGYADGTLAKFSVGAEDYFSLPRGFVFASLFSFGFMPFDADEVGISERYFLGGSDSLRGFRYRGAGPHDAKDDDVAIGGASALLWQNELRYPVTKDFSVLAFQDIGLIERDAIEFGKVRASAGAGARYRIRPVTVAVDLGWAFSKDSDDETEVFHIRLGSRF